MKLEKSDTMKKITLLIILATLIPNFLLSQPGTLDLSFGTAGKTMNTVGTNAITNDSALQEDGKIICVGNTYSIAPGSSFLVTRYLTNGDLDTTFGNSGIVTTLVGDHCSAASVAVQPDGRIVVAGTTYATPGNILQSDIMVVRYNTDGTPDESFGNDGIKIINLNQSQSINAMLIHNNGNITLGGSFTLLSNPNLDTFGLIRLTPEGNLDLNFGSNGYVYTPNIYRGEIMDLQFIDGDDIIAVGRRHIINNYLMVRYNINGQVVNSFGSSSNGIVEVTLNDIALLHKCVIASNNHIYAVGATYNNTKYNAFVTKYTSTGIIDNTFGNNGLIIRDFGSDVAGQEKYGFAKDVCLDNNNNLLIGYSVGLPTNYDFALESYDLSGNLNLSFGTDGYFTTTFGPGHEYFSTMLVQPDNKIVMAGNKGLQVLTRVNNEANLGNPDLALVDRQIALTPNPFADSDAVFLRIDKSGVLSVDLIDLRGVRIATLISAKKLFGETNLEKLDLGRFALPRGIYLLKVRMDNQIVKTIKISKQ